MQHVRRFWKVGLAAVVVIVVAAGAAIYVLDRPTVPAAAPTLEIDHTALLPPEAPFPEYGSYLVASNCAARLENEIGYTDMCWGVLRQADSDPNKDYYAINVSGTFGGQTIRWFKLEARPLDTTMLAGTDGLPMGNSAGCHPLPLSEPQQPGVAAGERLCGRVEAGPTDVEGGWRVTWSCEPCVLMDHADRAIDLEMSVYVADGTLPNWIILASFGS